MRTADRRWVRRDQPLDGFSSVLLPLLGNLSTSRSYRHCAIARHRPQRDLRRPCRRIQVRADRSMGLALYDYRSILSISSSLFSPQWDWHSQPGPPDATPFQLGLCGQFGDLAYSMAANCFRTVAVADRTVSVVTQRPFPDVAPSIPSGTRWPG